MNKIKIIAIMFILITAFNTVNVHADFNQGFANAIDAMRLAENQRQFEAEMCARGFNADGTKVKSMSRLDSELEYERTVRNGIDKADTLLANGGYSYAIEIYLKILEIMSKGAVPDFLTIEYSLGAYKLGKAYKYSISTLTDTDSIIQAKKYANYWLDKAIQHNSSLKLAAKEHYSEDAVRLSKVEVTQ